MMPAIVSPILIAASLGEWVEANWFSIIQLLIIVIGGIAALIRMQANIDILSRRVAELDEQIEHTLKLVERNRDRIDGHTADAERHVNHLHMRAIESRIDKIDARFEKIEAAMTAGFREMQAMLNSLLKR